MTEEIFEIGQSFKDNYPPEAAIWCNEHNAHIEIINGIYIIKKNRESVPETCQEKVNRLENLYQMNRWQREAILAEDSPYSIYTKAKAQEIEDIAIELRKLSDD